MGSKLYVGNLDSRTTTDDLIALFGGAGKVENAHVITHHDTGESKGFGFVQMASETEAQNAISLYNGHVLRDKPLIVNEARPSENQAPGAVAPAMRKFKEIKHKRRGGADRHRFH